MVWRVVMISNDGFQRFEVSFWELSRKMERLWNDIFLETFPGSQSKIVYLLKQHGSLKMSEIAHMLKLTAGAVTTASGHLIDHGYVERVTSAKDRRVIELRLTASGVETLSALQEKGRAAMRHVFRHLDDGQVALLEKIFQQANAHVDTLKEK